jgi:hypothetical protein
MIQPALAPIGEAIMEAMGAPSCQNATPKRTNAKFSPRGDSRSPCEVIALLKSALSRAASVACQSLPYQTTTRVPM